MKFVIGVSTQDACRLMDKLVQKNPACYLQSGGGKIYRPVLNGERTPFCLFLNDDGTWDMSAEVEV